MAGVKKSRVAAICKLVFCLMPLGFALAKPFDTTISVAPKSPRKHDRLCFLKGSKDSGNSAFNLTPTNGTTNGTRYFMYNTTKWASFDDGDKSPQTEIPDKYYFEFTQKNIDASKIDEFYAQWTIERQLDPIWNLTSEWKLFNSDFGNTRK